MKSIQPRVITRSDPRKVEIEWTDGHKTVYETWMLRAICPCAHCVDELSGERRHDPQSVPHDLLHEDVSLVGSYALTIRFADAHQTGIFPFRMLREYDPDESSE